MDKQIDALYQIQQDRQAIAEKRDNLAKLPYAKKYYDVDLDKRTIETPEFLSVEKDHRAENVYFKLDRYFDYVDLSTLTCVIQYVNAKNETGIYVVPYYDIFTFNNEYKMVIPWCLDGRASAATGNVVFAIRFYKIDPETKKLIYNMNTIPSTSRIMYGLDVQDPDMGNDYDLTDSAYDYLMKLIQELSQRDIHWVEYS